MNIYLPGPRSEDQQQTAALLRERGYRVCTSADVAKPNYRLNGGTKPTARECRQNQAHEMHMADCVVLTEELEPAERYELVQACRYMGMVVVEYADLPALAPGCGTRDQVLQCIDLTAPLRDDPEEDEHVPTAVALLVLAKEIVVGIANGFNRRFGWFFTNGNKAQQLARYDHEPKHLTTT